MCWMLPRGCGLLPSNTLWFALAAAGMVDISSPMISRGSPPVSHPVCDKPHNSRWTLVTRFGIPCYLADASVVPPSFDPAIAALIDFENIFIGRGETPDVLRLEDWLRKTGRQDDSDLLLQMDIEGGEYDVLADTPRDVLRQFRILVIEFHSLHLLFAEAWRCHMRSLVDALTRDFHVVHIHPNNYAPVFAAHGLEIPDVMEITFLRKDRSQNTGPAGRFPHPLDDPCSPSRPDIVLPALFRGPTGQGPE